MNDFSGYYKHTGYNKKNLYFDLLKHIFDTYLFITFAVLFLAPITFMISDIFLMLGICIRAPVRIAISFRTALFLPIN
jgi:type III secretory pathway component EscR